MIEAALTIRMVFHPPLRQTEGFLCSLADMLEVEIHIPDHTTLSRQLKTLGEIPFRALASHRPIHVLIDSTGLRTCVGNVREPPKNRAWRKLHLTVDAGNYRDHPSMACWTCPKRILSPLAIFSNNSRILSNDRRNPSVSVSCIMGRSAVHHLTTIT